MTRIEALDILELDGNPKPSHIRHAFRKKCQAIREDNKTGGTDQFLRVNNAYIFLLQGEPTQDISSKKPMLAQDFPGASDEELMWLLHPRQDIREAYRTYYGSEAYLDDKSYNQIAAFMNLMGYTSLLISIFLVLRYVYPEEYFKPMVALTLVFTFYLTPNFKNVGGFRWSTLKRNFPLFLLESVPFRFGLMIVQLFWFWYALHHMLDLHLIWIVLFLVLTQCIQTFYFNRHFKFPFSIFVAAGLSAFLFNILFSFNALISFDTRFEQYTFEYCGYVEIPHYSNMFGNNLYIIHETPLIALNNEAYQDAYLFRLRPWTGPQSSNKMQLEISTGILGFDVVREVTYIKPNY